MEHEHQAPRHIIDEIESRIKLLTSTTLKEVKFGHFESDLRLALWGMYAAGYKVCEAERDFAGEYEDQWHDNTEEW